MTEARSLEARPAHRGRPRRHPAVTIVAHPCDETSLRGAIDAAGQALIEPVLVGPEAKIRAVAAEHGIDLAGRTIVDAPHSHAAAACAVKLIREGKGELLMKGSLHTDELMREVTASATGLRTDRRISHVFIMDVPGHAETLFITDAAINIFPDLDTKRDIVQNAIDLWVGIGMGTPRVAILSAVETVTTKIPSTIEAAALCKMAERGQITGGLLDGPLAFDNAIDPEAARIKGITSPVAGHAQILVVPDLEAGNMLAKNLSFLAHADAAGIVLGARVPIILTSRGGLRPHPARLLRGRCALCQRAAGEARGAGRLMQAILVLNAGSSSLKFQIFAIDGDGLERRVKGQIDGIGVRPRLKAAGADGAALVDRSYPPAELPDLPAATAELRRWLQSLGGYRAPRHRAPGRARRPGLRPAGAGRRGRAGAARRRSSRWRRCTSRTTSRRSGWRCRSTRSCRRSPASTPPSIAAIRRTPTATPCRGRSTTRACAATASTGCPTSTSPSGCARWRPTSPTGG